MFYVKQSGSQWESVYAVDEENLVVSEITARFSENTESIVTDYIASTHSVGSNSYDAMAIEALKVADKITKKDWADSKKAFIEYVKNMGVISD